MRFTKVALFDLDGVVLDTRAATALALGTVAETALGHPVEADRLTYAATMPPVDALAWLGVRDAPSVYAAHFDSALSLAVDRVRPFEGVVAGMVQLAANGVGLGIVTAQARRRLDYLLPPTVSLLANVIITHEDAPPKPAPDPVVAACRRLGVFPDRALFIGDTATDIAAGRSAGVLTVGAGWGFAGADALRRAGAEVILEHPHQVGIGLMGMLPTRH